MGSSFFSTTVSAGAVSFTRLAPASPHPGDQLRGVDVPPQLPLPGLELLHRRAHPALDFAHRFLVAGPNPVGEGDGVLHLLRGLAVHLVAQRPHALSAHVRLHLRQLRGVWQPQALLVLDHEVDVHLVGLRAVRPHVRHVPPATPGRSIRRRPAAPRSCKRWGRDKSAGSGCRRPPCPARPVLSVVLLTPAM